MCRMRAMACYPFDSKGIIGNGTNRGDAVGCLTKGCGAFYFLINEKKCVFLRYEN